MNDRVREFLADVNRQLDDAMENGTGPPCQRLPNTITIPPDISIDDLPEGEFRLPDDLILD